MAEERNAHGHWLTWNQLLDTADWVQTQKENKSCLLGEDNLCLSVTFSLSKLLRYKLWRGGGGRAHLQMEQKRLLSFTATRAFPCDSSSVFQVPYVSDALKVGPAPSLCCLLFTPCMHHALPFPSLSSVFLFWRSFPCSFKSNIWVSLHPVEQDLQDIVGRMWCVSWSRFLCGNPQHTHAHTSTHCFLTFFLFNTQIQVQQFTPDILQYIHSATTVLFQAQFLKKLLCWCKTFELCKQETAAKRVYQWIALSPTPNTMWKGLFGF